MYNRLWKDLTDRLAKEPFEGIYWGWGPQWVSFIKVDSPITKDKPLWIHKEKSLDNILLFGLTPDQLQLEIIRYWQQPFWKRCFLSLFTSINHKIKLWSYYHRCLAVRMASIENIYRIDKPIDSVFELYFGEEIVQRLYRTTLKLTKYLEKHAGDFKFEKNDQSVDFYLKGNGRFFTKLMNEKLASFNIENKHNLQFRLRNEFNRHKMMLFTYLATWEKKIFDEPIYFDDIMLIDTYVDFRTGKKMTYASRSVEEWIKLKRHILESILLDNSPEQSTKIKNLLENTLFTINQVFNQQLDRLEHLIAKVKCDRLAANKAIQQANILQKYFIIFKKIVFLFHPDKSFGNENLRVIQTELFKDFNGLVKGSIANVKQGLQTLEDCLITQKNKLAFYKMRNKVFLRIAELNKMRAELNTRLNQVADKINNHQKCQEIKSKLWQIEAEIEWVHSSYCNYNDFIKRPQAPLTRATLKLFFEPLNNPKQDKSEDQEVHETYEAKRYLSTKRPLTRYRPVF